MTSSEATLLGREAMWMVLLVGGPVLFATLFIGTIVSLLQAVTQVHEQTLSFVPKLVVVGVVFAIGSGWMAEELVQYGQASFARAAGSTR